MAYEKLNLKTADKFTAADLAHIEQGIADAGGGGGAEPVTADTLKGATDTGKSVLKAATAAAARTAIGAGTSSLTLGTTATTALKGDTVIPAAPATGTAAALTAGTETTAKVWSAKAIADFVKAEVAKVTTP